MSLLNSIKQKFFLYKFKKKLNVKIYDCFLFFNENDLLEIRLNELYKIVDYFVIFECNSSFQKKEKGFLLDLNRFEKFKNKIIYIKNTSFIRSPDPWQFETHQRNEIISGLINANKEDMIVLSDLDEIPKRKAIIESFYNIYKNNKKYIKLELTNFRYAFNNILNNNVESLGPIVTKKENISSMQELRAQKVSDFIVKDGGWHYSFLCSPEDIIFKLNSYSHKEYNKWPNNDINFVKQRINNGQSNFGHEEQAFNRIFLNRRNCPKYVLKNKKKYAMLIFKNEKASIWAQIKHLYNTQICKIKKYTLGLRSKSS